MDRCKKILKPFRSPKADARMSPPTRKYPGYQYLYLAYTTTTLRNLIMGNTNASEFQNAIDKTPKKTQQGGRGWAGNRGTSAEDPPDFLVKLAKILVQKSLAEDNIDGITENVFLKYICKANKPLGHRLFQHLVRHWQEQSNQEQEKSNFGDLLSRSAFLASSHYILGLLSDSEQLEFYIKVFAGDEEKISQGNLYELIFAAYHISKVAHQTCCLPDDILMAVVKAAMHGKESVSKKYLHGWVSQNCPRLVMWVHKYITHMLTVGHRTIPDNTNEDEDDTDTPILDCPNKSSCITLHPALIWLLTCTLPTLYSKQQKSLPSSNSLLLDPHIFIDRMISAVSPTHWVPLYNSDNHGLSINRFQHHVFGYHGPTLMFITAEGGNMFCLASDEEWRDSKHFWGSDHCICMHLTPEYRVIESGPKMMYFNVSSRGFPTGIHIGTDSTNRALTVDLNLSLVTYRRIPYKLFSIEAWGCGTTEAKEAQVELKKREVKDSENRRKVNLNSVDWVDNPDRYLLELAGGRPTYAQYDKKTNEKKTNT
ncbi:uncharacterized protein LOC122247364 [Penaeus japonicus]|uniref:uncharacterized protein LOC122247364 n=1 Tax=Penaeus japonicus TaxID=27405 RepID=UPI001C712B19|nr:uncharacterized protein LOC122247364 [Penaeus japonicus]